MAIISIYKQFYMENSGGKISISNRMISLKERWEPVWDTTPALLDCTWVINGVTQPFNHKSLDLHRLPFVNFNPTDPYSLIMVLVCFLSYPSFLSFAYATFSLSLQYGKDYPCSAHFLPTLLFLPTSTFMKEFVIPLSSTPSCDKT